MRPALFLAVLLQAASAFAQTSDPRIALMERAAWNALANGQHKTAADIFRQALASEPNDAELHAVVAWGGKGVNKRGARLLAPRYRRVWIFSL